MLENSIVPLGLGGFYSDTMAFVSKECKRCPEGTYIPRNKWPGKRPEDCKACPQGITDILQYLTNVVIKREQYVGDSHNMVRGNSKD